MFHIHDIVALEQLRKRLRIEPGAVRRLRNAFYKKHQPSEVALEELPEPQRDIVRNELVPRQSSIDG